MLDQSMLRKQLSKTVTYTKQGCLIVTIMARIEKAQILVGLDLIIEVIGHDLYQIEIDENKLFITNKNKQIVNLSDKRKEFVFKHEQEDKQQD